MNAYLADYASEREKSKFVFLFVDGDRNGWASQSTCATENTFVIIERNVTTSILKRLPYLGGIESCGIPGEKIF